VRYIQWQLLPFAGQVKYTHFDGLPDHWETALGDRLFCTPVDTVRETCLALGAAPASIPRNLGDLKIDYVSDCHFQRASAKRKK
jgi:hypothetical protein